MPQEHTVVILMGVCGSGKTTIGQQLAQQLGCLFYDGDDFHPPANVEKMARGMPLTDEDRFPWLQLLATEMEKWMEKGHAILACSALKQRYRDILIAGRPQVRVVYLKGSKELIRQRLAERTHRYMPATLLESQFATLEEPEDAWVVDVGKSVEETVDELFLLLKSRLYG